MLMLRNTMRAGQKGLKALTAAILKISQQCLCVLLLLLLFLPLGE